MKDSAHFLAQGNGCSQGAGLLRANPPFGFGDGSAQSPTRLQSHLFGKAWRSQALGGCPERRSSMIASRVQQILPRSAPHAGTVLALDTGPEGVCCARGHASQSGEAEHEANKQMNNRGTWRECCFMQGTEQGGAWNGGRSGVGEGNIPSTHLQFLGLHSHH